MNTALISTKTPVFPYVLRFTNLRLYAFVTLFVALDVAIPRFCHWIHPLAGPMFLSMFFFILLAGLLFGWRAGLLVGVFTPIISYGPVCLPCRFYPESSLKLYFMDWLPECFVSDSR